MDQDTSTDPQEQADAPVESEKSTTDVITEVSSPSDEKGDVAEISPLELVETALKESRGEQEQEPEPDNAEAPPASDETDQEAAEPEGEAEKEDASPEEDEDSTRFDKHPRFRQLVEQKNSWKEKAEQAQTQAEEFKADHEAVENLREFMGQNGLVQDDLNTALDIATLVKNNPAQALEALVPIVHQLAVSTGRILPNDLQTQVQQNQIDEATARQIAQQRGQVNQQQNTLQREQEGVKQQRFDLMEQSIGAFTDGKRASDPDFTSKEALFARVLKSDLNAHIQENGVPDTQTARKIAEGAWDFVNEQMVAATPKSSQKEMRPVAGTNPPKPVAAPPDSPMAALEEGLRALR